MTSRPRRLFAMFPALVLVPIPALAQCFPAVLSPGVPQLVNCSPTIFTVAPVPAQWNAVAISSASTLVPSDWNLNLLPAISAVPGVGADFALSNGRLGAPAFTSGTVTHVAGSVAGQLAYVTASPLALNAPLATTFPAGAPIQLYEFEVLVAGAYTVNVNASASHGWAVFDPGAGASWRPRVSAVAGAAGGTSGTVALGTGWHALAIFRSPVSPSAPAITVSVTGGVPTGAPVILSMSTQAIPAPLPPSDPPLAITIDGLNLGPWSTVYANGVLVPSFVPTPPNPLADLAFSLPGTIPQRARHGAITIVVLNQGTMVSNAFGLVVGGLPTYNDGTITMIPPAPLPGAPCTVRIAGGAVGTPVTLVASLPPASPVMLPNTAFLLGLDLGSLVPIADGMGVFGPAAPVVFGAAPAAWPGSAGAVDLAGFTLPSPPLGVDLALQAVHTGPPGMTAPIWLSWTLTPFGI